MVSDIEHLRPHLHAFNFTSLLVEEMGWNHYRGPTVPLRVDDDDYTLKPIADKEGFVVYVCEPATKGVFPLYPTRLKIETQAAKLAYEHLIIFVDSEKSVQIWQWVKREAGRPGRPKELQYMVGQTGEALLQRLQGIAFSLDEESSLNIATVTQRLTQALDVEKVTKQFYDSFRKVHQDFLNHIDGIQALGDREWYASLMLNRLMFIYFIQMQRFLDSDPDYLRNRLKKVRESRGPGMFHSFYRMFLLRLFHDGLGKPEIDRAPELSALLGRVPYLNGGIFDVHTLERDYPDIQIPDEAFEQIFDFFADYQWHLDERSHGEDNEINPDVLGYIFEKYINQKEMGAYYTKEDITGYITRNTVIPFLFDIAQKECPVAFGDECGVWRLLSEDPDRYIYPPVGHGITWNARETEPHPIEKPHDIPPEVAAGIHDLSKRGDWNLPAPDEYALPTETWREVVARRQRYEEVRLKLASGEVREINDLITLNLDVCRFAEDVISRSEGPELVRAFWHAMRDVTVLDPTCGSGAFLFAALNILEPLYTACLESMQGFVDDLDRLDRAPVIDTLKDFQAVLAQVEHHFNQRYFILKTIVISNLYGVDIMEEAVEVCKLRLFLKLVAQVDRVDQIEPLPDIDFNIRAGNTLVGFESLDAVRDAINTRRDAKGIQSRMVMGDDLEALANIEVEAEAADSAFRQFQTMQTVHDMDTDEFARSKANLRNRLAKLAQELNLYLASDYGVDTTIPAEYEKWITSHRPFHWFTEFYGIMSSDGFDVIVGNPPYVQYSKVKSEYTIIHYLTERCGDLYAYVMERSNNLLSKSGSLGMIVPVSIANTDGFSDLRECLESSNQSLWCSHFSTLPSYLFSGVEKRLTIWISRQHTQVKSLHTTGYMRWLAEERPVLFASIAYQDWDNSTDTISCGSIVPKIGTEIEVSILSKLSNQSPLSNSFSQKSKSVIFYTRKVGYFVQFMNFIPTIHDKDGNLREPSELKRIFFSSIEERDSTLAVLNSGLFFWYFCVHSDVRNLNLREYSNFPFSHNQMNAQVKNMLDKYSTELMEDYHRNSRSIKYGNLTIQALYPRPSKPIIDMIDKVLMDHYSFTNEELDFIINYDIKYRTGAN